jgi:adenosylcobinamide-GDP ribazoletransferase
MNKPAPNLAVPPRELRIFFTALMFFTRIPCPAWVDHDEEFLHKSSRYFPLIGWIVGGLGAVACSLAVWSGAALELALVLSLVATVFATGAFHEDGFADMCDGFGGGWTKERILAIMQDSRLGTFGAIALALLLACKVLALVQIAEVLQGSSSALRFHAVLGLVLLTGHALSRFLAVTFLVTDEYARLDGESKAKPLATRMNTGEIAFAALCGLLPLVLLAALLSWWVLVVLVPLVLVRMRLAGFFRRWIGGYTGDCLGGTQQLCEVVFYLGLIVALRL